MKKNDVFKNKLGGAVDKSAEAYIKQHISILPELEALIPPLSVEEHALLQASIAQEGCRESLLLWRQDETRYILIDGHNRYSICRTLGIDFNIKVQENLPDLDSVKDWMILNQLGKRNITEETKSYLRGLQYKREKQAHGGDRKTSGQDDYLKTHERLAEQHKVSPKTIQRDEAFAETIEALTAQHPDLKWKILNREIQVPKNAPQKLAHASEEELNVLAGHLIEVKNFAKSCKLAFPDKAENESKEDDFASVINDLRKAMQHKDKATAEELLQHLHEQIRAW